MLGLLTTLLFCATMVGFGRFLFGRWMTSLDVLAQISLSGILGLGVVGLVTLPIGMLPNGLHWGVGIVTFLAGLGGVWLLFKRFPPLFSRKATDSERILGLCIGLGLLVCLFYGVIATLTPSTGVDWDTIAYHLAVPKLWIQAGRIYPITFIHHSNFPQSVDNLYIWGLTWGGQSGAKAFQLAYYAFGSLGLFGITRQRYGATAGAWAALAFATVPVILWEAGTAYIDVAHGLYAGLGVIVLLLAIVQKAEETPLWPVAGLLLGFAAGSKYTGLQTLIAAAVVIGGYSLYRKAPVAAKRVALCMALAVGVSFVWYAKNVAWVGNPVYPFFYEKFGGKNWSQYNADIYREQQQIFGLKREGPAAGFGLWPASVLGLAVEPGRFTDPKPDADLGSPVGSIGGAILGGGFVWLLSGRVKRFEGLLLAFIGFSLLTWFVLSQQSRYAISFVPILALLIGGGVVRLRAGPLLAAAVALQTFMSFWVLNLAGLGAELPVATGSMSQADYLTKREPFYPASQYLNQNGKNGKVALYDEVHGFYLDVPYFWANPGHTTEIGYDRLNDGSSFVDRLKQMGFDRIYVSLSQDLREAKQRKAAALAVGQPQVPYGDEFKNNQGEKYLWLISDAVRLRRVELEQVFRGGFLFKLK